MVNILKKINVVYVDEDIAKCWGDNPRTGEKHIGNILCWDSWENNRSK